MNTSKEDLSAKIISIVADQLNENSEDLSSDFHLVDDLGADSLDIVELIMAMEEEFEIEIPDEDAEKVLTISDIVNYIESKTKS